MSIKIQIERDTVEAFRIPNDLNGNPRFVIHFHDLETFEFRFSARVRMTQSERFERIKKLSRKYGGKAYRGKDIAGGIVFQAYECQLPEIIRKIHASEN